MPAEYPPNPRLRAARLQRNWTYADVARELRTLMLSRGETQVGVAFQHVYRWEVGGRRPGMRHRKYLCLLYDLSRRNSGSSRAAVSFRIWSSAPGKGHHRSDLLSRG